MLRLLVCSELYHVQCLMSIAFMLVVLNPIVAAEFEVNFDGNSTLYRCPSGGSCHKLCSEAESCANDQFECDAESLSCDVLCVGADSCAGSSFFLNAAHSSVRCAGSGSCDNILFECGSTDTVLDGCAFAADSALTFTSSLLLIHGRVDVLSLTLFGASERVWASCAHSADGASVECDAMSAVSCMDSACSSDSVLDDTQSALQDALDCAVTSSMFVLVGVLMSSMLLSAVLLYGCLECVRCVSPSDDRTSTNLRQAHAQSPSGSQALELNQLNQESTHFARSFMLTLITHLYGKQNKQNALNCGILLVPADEPIEPLLRALNIDTARQCKVPVTHEFLRHYGNMYGNAAGSSAYLVVQSGYIYAREVYATDLVSSGSTKDMLALARRKKFVVIDCARKSTRSGDRWYLRISVMSERTTSAERFVSELKQHGINVNLGESDDERTRTWRARDSMRLDSSFNRAAENQEMLTEAVRQLTLQRTAAEHAEDVGATIVVIPADKSMADYKAFVRQSLPVSMEVSGGSLLSIFGHQSPLHDGAIFVRGDRIIAVKAFFRLTGDSDSVSIGHGTRHASAKEFSKHSFKHRTIVLVLSEEDGLLRSCVDGVLHKLSIDNIGSVLAEQQHRRKRPQRTSSPKNVRGAGKTGDAKRVSFKEGNANTVNERELPSTTGSGHNKDEGTNGLV